MRLNADLESEVLMLNLAEVGVVLLVNVVDVTARNVVQVAVDFNTLSTPDVTPVLVFVQK